MSRRREREADKENADRWLLTYSDLITLLMIFFVVLYSISKVDAEKFKAVADSLSVSLGGAQAASPALADDSSGTALIDLPELEASSEEEKMSIEVIKNKIDAFAKDNQIEHKLSSSIEERGLVVSIQDTLLFDSGSAVITAGARSILEKIAVVLYATPNYIRVEGHTDDLPIRTEQFPSNWELSAARATHIVQLMIASGISPVRLSETGYSEYRPLVPNDSEANRNRNRRVDLIILRSIYDAIEPGRLAE
ncbi:MAG: OmpA family protein [Peptococcaceae bacterium]|jgi:chemotaxis protein MotB|nr:OmpA family protein [Peptococcaceae bacterium]